MPAKKMRSIHKSRHKAYEGIKKSVAKKHGKGRKAKAIAAKIANAGKTAAGRKRMAQKAAKTRKQRAKH